jgi:hypothetical protein
LHPIFPGTSGKTTIRAKIIIDDFQRSLFKVLENKIPKFSWTIEYSPASNIKDTIDIFGKNSLMYIVIELDKHRADQVAKKFVSRSALLIDKSIFYISLCYPGTIRMNKGECIKYFGYCKELSTRMGNEYAGFIIE